MKRGQIVDVFEDPITEKKFEGKAELCNISEHIIKLDKLHKIERWGVKFLEDEYAQIVERWIKISKEN